MEIFPKVLVKTLDSDRHITSSYFFENVSVSYHTKEMATFKKLATTKSTAQFLGLMWVLFSRHILGRAFVCSVGGSSLPVFISHTGAVQR